MMKMCFITASFINFVKFLGPQKVIFKLFCPVAVIPPSVKNCLKFEGNFKEWGGGVFQRAVKKVKTIFDTLFREPDIDIFLHENNFRKKNISMGEGIGGGGGVPEALMV